MKLGVRRILKRISKLKKKTFVFSSIIESAKLIKRKEIITYDELLELVEELSKCTSNCLNKNNSDYIEEKVKIFLTNLKNPKQTFKNKKVCFNDEILTEIIESNTHSKTLKEIKSEYINKTNTSSFSISCLRRYMINYLGYSYRKCSLIHEETTSVNNIYRNFVFLKKLLEVIKNEHVIAFLDESSFSDRSLSKKFWIRKKATTIKHNRGRLKSISCISMICKNGVINYSLNDQAYDSNSFIDFISKTTEILENDEKFRNDIELRKFTVILDNAKIHCSRISIKQLKNGKINAIFQPPYSPMFNGCELLWGNLKKKIRRKIFSTM